MVLLVNRNIRLRLRRTWVKLERMSSPVRRSDIPRLHTATSISMTPVGRWEMPRARRKEIQSPLVLPFPCDVAPASVGMLEVERGVKKIEGKHFVHKRETQG